MTSTLGAIPAGLWNYDSNDRLSTDTYDDAGNTVWSAGIENKYDFENHLIQHGEIKVVYDGDGNRVAKTVGGVTTAYLVDTNNPTGYAQVINELQGGQVTRSYTYGLDLISQTQPINGAWTTTYYGYDGHGSVRFLTDPNANVTDTYDYDAFGNLINQTGPTPNNYLYAGEPFDPDLGLYYNRARYLDVRTGRFWGMDTWDGDTKSPKSLHKYLYVDGDPLDNVDPSGHATLAEVNMAMAITMVVSTMAMVLMQRGVQSAVRSLGEATTGAAGELYDEFSYAAGRAIAEAELEIQKTYLSVATAIAMAQSLVIAQRRTLTRTPPKVVPMPLSVIPNVAAHVLTAQAAGFPFELTRVSFAQARMNRRNALTGIGRASFFQSWDEYPFASSQQGGYGASVVPVPLRENLVQGGIIAASYLLENISVGDDYTVVVIP
jgi:RHS repeat-associated protein